MKFANESAPDSIESRDAPSFDQPLPRKLRMTRTYLINTLAKQVVKIAQINVHQELTYHCPFRRSQWGVSWMQIQDKSHYPCSKASGKT